MWAGAAGKASAGQAEWDACEQEGGEKVSLFAGRWGGTSLPDSGA